MVSNDSVTLFGRPIDRRTLLTLTGKTLAGGAVAGLWLSPELAHFVDAAARGQKESGSVTVMKQFSPNLAKWKTVMSTFTSETGIKVNLDDQNYNNQYQKISTQGQSGTRGDDVVEIDTVWTGSFGAAGFTLDLTNFLPSSIKQGIAPASLSSVSYKGKAYGVPEYNSSKHFFYNLKMLEAVGLHRAPATLDELLAYCEILKRNQSKLGIEYPMSWSWKQFEGLTCDYVQMVDSYGGRFFAEDNVTPAFNRGAGVKALTTMVTMLKKGYAAPGSLTHEEIDVENDIQAGKIAMSTNWEGTQADSLNPSLASKAVLGHIRMALIPGTSSRKSGSCLGPEGWAIMKTSPNQAQAKAFINWFITTKTQKSLMATFDQYPIYSALYTDPSLRQLTAQADKQDDFAVYGEQFNYAQARPNFPGYLDASKRLQVHLHKAFLGQETPQQALDAAAHEMTSSGGNGNNP